jgi:phage protein D
MSTSKSSSTSSVDFDVLVNQSQLPVEAEPCVTSITVDDSIDIPSMFTIEITGTANQPPNRWVDDEELFAVGNAVEIKLRYGSAMQSLIKGEITGLEPEFASDRQANLIVRGYDRRHRLQRGRKTRTFLQLKDSQIASQVASAAGLSANVVDSSVTHDYVIQANQTDLDFLQERAHRIGYEVVIEDKTVYFRPVSNDKSEALTLELGKDLFEFYPRLSSSLQVSEVNVRGWDPKTKKELVGKASTLATTMGGEKTGPQMASGAFGSAIRVVSAQPIRTQAEADQIAKAGFNDLALDLIAGEGECTGRTDLLAGKVVKIIGVGNRFSGQYYITSTTHHYDAQDGYRTNFTVRRNAS